MRDNYQIARENAEKLFVQMDQDALIRLHDLRADAEYIYIDYLGRGFRIDRASGRVEYVGAQPRGAGFSETLAIFDYLSHTPAPAAGRWCATNSLKHVGQSQPSAGKLHRARAEALQAKLSLIVPALAGLSCAPFPRGDAACVFPVFSDLRAAFQFWAADEDFPAQIGFFWDENVLSRLRYETLYYVMGDFLELLEARIAELERQ